MSKTAYLNYLDAKCIKIKNLFEIETAMKFPLLGEKLKLKFNF